MTPPRSSRDIIAEFLWRELFGHDVRLVWAKLTADKRRPFESRADALTADLRKNGTLFPEDRLSDGNT